MSKTQILTAVLFLSISSVYAQTDEEYNKLLNLEQNNYSQVISHLTKEIESNPKNDVAYYYRGKTYAYQEKNAQAISDFTKAIEINPKFTQAYYNRALSNYTFIQIHELDSKYIDMFPDLVLSVYLKGNFSQAISDYTKVIEINPKFTGAYFKIGEIYFQLREYAKSIVYFSKDLELSSNSDFSFLNGVNYANEVNEPDIGHVYWIRARAYYFLRDYDKVWADLHKAEELNCPIYSEFITDLKKASGRDN